MEPSKELTKKTTYIDDMSENTATLLFSADFSKYPEGVRGALEVAAKVFHWLKDHSDGMVTGSTSVGDGANGQLDLYYLDREAVRDEKIVKWLYSLGCQMIEEFGWLLRG